MERIKVKEYSIINDIFNKIESEDGACYIWADCSPLDISATDLGQRYEKICEDLKREGFNPMLLEIRPSCFSDMFYEVSKTTNISPYPNHICYNKVEELWDVYRESVSELANISTARIAEVEALAKDLIKISRVIESVNSHLSRIGELKDTECIYVKPDFLDWKICEVWHLVSDENVIAIKYYKNDNKL